MAQGVRGVTRMMARNVFTLGWGLVLCATTPAQGPAEKELYEQLMNGPDRAKAMETVLKNPENYSPVMLHASAMVALTEKRLEGSGFLFYAGQLRARFERECFPPKGKGGENPYVGITALSQQVGAVVNPLVMDDAKLYAKVIDRVKQFVPKAGEDYNPGYEYAPRKTEQDAHAAVKAKREEFIRGLSDLGALLEDPQYMAAARTIRAYNHAGKSPGPTNAEVEAAAATLTRIEKEKGVAGLASANNKNLAIETPKRLGFVFADTRFFHVFAKDDQHEYTPLGQKDLKKWTDMVTIQFYREAKDHAGLTKTAQAVLEKYQAAKAVIVKNEKVVEKPDAGAEQLIVARFAQLDFHETVFARFRVHDGAGMAVIYGHRIYGKEVENQMTEWFDQNKNRIEKSLLQWNDMPKMPTQRR
jgi:hypothetical protein